MVRWLRIRLLSRVAFARAPDVYIGGRENTYLERWHVIRRNPVFNIYLHHFKRSDDDRALHDHPWINLSILLSGAYTEHTIKAGGVHVKTVRTEGAIKFRMPWHAHRIELTHGDCWTLFITGPRLRRWGFHCPAGWVWWKNFVAIEEGGVSLIGRGCGEQ